MIDSATYYARVIVEDYAASDDALNKKQYVYIIQDTVQKCLLILYVGTKQSKMNGNNGVWLIQQCVALVWLPQFEGCVGGDLFKVHTQALRGNEFPTLLFATIQLLKAIVIDLLAVSERALIRHHR